VYDPPPAAKQPTFKLREYWIWLVLPFLGLIRYFFAFWMLVFLNAEYLVGINWDVYGLLPLVIFTVLAAYVTLRLSVWLYLRLRPLNYGLAYSAAIIGVIVWIGWVLFPVVCDTHESWIDRPNKRCDCRGMTVRFYPGGVTDGTETEYCIGREIF
jgi:hypothetical protein